MKQPRCTNCHHGPHPERACVVVKVSGPPCTKGKANHDTGSYEHGTRAVEPCGCTEYTAPLNGHPTPTQTPHTSA